MQFFQNRDVVLAFGLAAATFGICGKKLSEARPQALSSFKGFVDETLTKTKEVLTDPKVAVAGAALMLASIGILTNSTLKTDAVAQAPKRTFPLDGLIC